MKVLLFLVFAYLLTGLADAATNVTALEREEILRHHNFLRRTAPPSPANMLPLVWNDELAAMAQEWALECDIDHGFPNRTNPPFPAIGQNIWKGSSTNINLTVVIQSWYDEINFYNWEETKCEPPPNGMCTHYTQLVWASTTDVGCGYYHCPTGGSVVVCNYGPMGNLANTRPYLEGPPCSQCASAEGWCDQGLCIDCPAQNCACPLQCKNCGVLDPTTCKCSCKDGWDSPDCSVPCVNGHPYCGANPGWPNAAQCNIPGFEVVGEYCREMCGYCAFATPGDPNACCGGQICYNGGYLDETTCSCVCPLGFGGKDCNGATTPSLVTVKPSMASTEQSTPYTGPSTPYTGLSKPSVPPTGPSKPNTTPSVPPTGPSKPHTKPSVPSTGPSVPSTKPTVPYTGPAAPLECFLCSSENATEKDPCHLEQELQATTETCKPGERCLVKQTVDAEGQILTVDRSCDRGNDCGAEQGEFSLMAADITEWRYCCDKDRCNYPQLQMSESVAAPTAPITTVLLFCLLLTVFLVWE